MGKINSRSKGSKNERDVCKWWQQWTGYPFTRVPSSGGLRWKRTFDTTGDIVCADNIHALKFKFSVECKNYKDINFEHALLDKKTSKINEFWDQAQEDANRGNKIPILMMKYNGMPKGEYFFCVNQMIADLIVEQADIEKILAIRTERLGVLFIFMASEILEKVNYKTLYRRLR